MISLSKAVLGAGCNAGKRAQCVWERAVLGGESAVGVRRRCQRPGNAALFSDSQHIIVHGNLFRIH
jgi:hypothetical protein